MQECIAEWRGISAYPGKRKKYRRKTIEGVYRMRLLHEIVCHLNRHRGQLFVFGWETRTLRSQKPIPRTVILVRLASSPTAERVTRTLEGTEGHKKFLESYQVSVASWTVFSGVCRYPQRKKNILSLDALIAAFFPPPKRGRNQNGFLVIGTNSVKSWARQNKLFEERLDRWLVKEK